MSDADSTGLSARIATLEARAAIGDLIMRYDLAIDACDWDALKHLFAQDARLGPHRGREAVVATLRSLRERHGRTRHVSHHPLLDVGEDAAVGVVPASSEIDIDGRTHVVAVQHHDSYVRKDGTWFFRRRRTRIQYVLPASDANRSMTDPLPVRWPDQRPREADR